MKKLGVFVAAGLLLFMSSCASLMTGNTQQVRVNSNVDAEIYQNGKRLGTTNTFVKVERKDLDQILIVQREGCKTKEYAMPVKTNPAVIMDYVLMAGFVGGGIALELVGVPGATSFGLISALPILTDVSQGANQKTVDEHTVNLECEE